jgi:hypothetical protein
MDPAPPKICVFCNQDCSRRPRSKDSRGRYMCNECLAKRRLKAGWQTAPGHGGAGLRITSLNVPAEAIAAGDPGHTMIGADPPDLAAYEPATARPHGAPAANASTAPGDQSSSQSAHEDHPGAHHDERPGAGAIDDAAPGHLAVVWTDPKRGRPRDLLEALAGRGN